MRALFLFVFLLLSDLLCAQRMDSIHVFKRIPAGSYTSASANALAWKLHKEDAPHRSLKGDDLDVAEEAMAQYKPHRHTSGPLPELSHVAIVFSGGRPVAFGVTDDLDRVINFTARTEYRISTWSEHLTVRALLARLVVE
ncbi:MAG TPA: hypothetical protein VGE21_05590 [Flavobacteriales bacterium]